MASTHSLKCPGERGRVGFGLLDVLELVPGQQDVLGAVVVLGVERALLADQEQPAVGDLLALEQLLVGLLVLGELLAAVVPGHGHGRRVRCAGRTGCG